jgi:hypothetical protein
MKETQEAGTQYDPASAQAPALAPTPDDPIRSAPHRPSPPTIKRDALREGTMSGSDQWLDVREAVDLCRAKTGGSIGAAQAKLCKACASGEVRFRESAATRRLYDLTLAGGGPLARSAWTVAEIDLKAGEVIVHHRRFRGVQISAEDLCYWLEPQSDRPEVAGSATEAKAAPARAAPGPKRVTSRDNAIRKRLEAGERPSNLKTWCHEIRVACGATESTRGFSDETIRKRTGQLSR